MKWSRLILSICAIAVMAILGIHVSPDETERTNSSTSAANASSTIEWYRVISVVDGDTIKIDLDGATTTVRLIGLDTPETVDPRRPVQCFGKEASDQMKLVLTGQYVKIETDPSQGLYDKYGRLLAYVYAPLNRDPAGLLMNKYMIEEGYGHEYTYNVPYTYQKEFKAAEADARAQKRGLWAEEACASV